MAQIVHVRKVRRFSPTKLYTAQDPGSSVRREKIRNWFGLNKTVLAVLVALISPIAALLGVFIGFKTLENQRETQLAGRLQNLIEWAASNEPLKKWEAVHQARSLAKSHQIDPPLALNIFGTVARNTDDEKLRGEVSDSIQDLISKLPVLDSTKWSSYETLDILCLQAAIAPQQTFRQRRLRVIAEFCLSYPDLKPLAASKLLALSQDLSRPQNAIDMLMSIFSEYGDPGILEKAIPTLWDALKARDVFGNTSNQDVVDFLESVATEKAIFSVTQANQSQMWAYLACAIVVKEKDERANYLAKFERITASKDSGLERAAQSLLGGIYKTTRDAYLQGIVKQIADDLAHPVFRGY